MIAIHLCFLRFPCCSQCFKIMLDSSIRKFFKEPSKNNFFGGI